MATLNKQPIFTSTPILISQTIDPVKYQAGIYNPTTNNSGVDPLPVFTATDDYGTLIERITVSACATILEPEVSEKYIYLFIYDTMVSGWNLYKSAYMPAVNIALPTLNPEIEWIFTGGLLLPDGYKIGFGASENNGNSGYKGDYLAITIEGSSYSQP